MFKEFREFIMRGNVLDLAVAVIIGAAFGLIVKSFVDDIIMPFVGYLFGGLDFTNYFLALSDKVTATTLAEAKKQGAVLAWGKFLTHVINFVIVGFIIFMVVRTANKLQKQKEEAPAEPPKQEVLLEEIRDLLAKKS
jgi:large conductance mechanosensitive channel